MDIASIPGTQAAIDKGAKLGKRAADAILDLRKNDGSQLPEPRVMATCSPGDDTCFPANTTPGLWQIDPISNIMVALGGNWPKVTPFVMTSADQFRAPVPPSLTRDAYKLAFKEVLLLGGDPVHDPSMTTSRSPKQTVIAKFWSYSTRATRKRRRSSKWIRARSPTC